MPKILNATICLRRDNDYNFDAIRDTFIPANGEVVLVDTATKGLRAKVGDGVSTFAELQYIDDDVRKSVQQGYYSNNIFYKDITMHTVMAPMINKIYIDKISSQVYYYNGVEYIQIEGILHNATDVMPGAMKLYNTVGYNIDGTMTQKSITDELDVRYKTTVDTEQELLVFTI